MTMAIAPVTAVPVTGTGADVSPPARRRAVVVPPLRPADLAAFGAAAGALALTGLPSIVRAACLAVFIAVGPGSAVLTWVPVPRRARLGTVPVMGMTIVTLGATVAMWSYRWNPPDLLWVQVVAVAASSGYWYYRNGTGILDAPRPVYRCLAACRPGQSASRRFLSSALSGAALMLWAVAVPGLPGTDASYFGLLFSGTGPLLVAAIALCACALLVAVRFRQPGPAAVAVGAAIVVSRATTFVATEVPLYDWTYKHLAVVDYIMDHGLIQPDGTDIYAQWAAFFVTSAWFSEVTGVAPIDVAHCFAPVIHVVLALTGYSGARVLGLSRRTAATAAFLLEVTNWVGQDYFSPQAWSLTLAYGMIVLLLVSRSHRAAGMLAVVVYAAIVPTHQLTPFWAVAVAAALCVFNRARPWWIAPAMAVLVGSYLLLNLEAVLPYGLISGGSPVSNAASNVLTSGLPAKDFTSAVVRGLSAVVVLAALACAVWRWRHKRPVLTVAVVAFSSFGLLFGQNYGGEAIFRVYLYALLGCSILIAPAVVAATAGRGAGDRRSRLRRLSARALAGCGLISVSVAGLHGYVALWPLVYETRAQIDLMNELTTNAELRTRFVMLRLGGMPTRVNSDYVDLTRFNSYYDDPISYDLWDGRDPRTPQLKANFPSERDLTMLTEEVPNGVYRTYVLFSEQSNRALRYYGDYRPDAVELVQDALHRSPNFRLIFEDGETKVFEAVNEYYHPRVRPAHIE